MKLIECKDTKKDIKRNRDGYFLVFVTKKQTNAVFVILCGQQSAESAVNYPQNLRLIILHQIKPYLCAKLLLR